MSDTVIRVHRKTEENSVYIERLEINGEVVSTFDEEANFIDLTPCEAYVDAPAELYDNGELIAQGQLFRYKETDGIVRLEFDWIAINSEVPMT